MGVSYECVCVYGIGFSFEEIKQLRESDVCNEVSKNIGCDNMSNIWDEMEDCEYHFTGNNNSCWGSNEKDIKFIIGYDMNNDKDLSEYNWVEMDIKIKELCKKYKLVYSKPKMVCDINIQ